MYSVDSRSGNVSGPAFLKIVRNDDRYINLPFFLTDAAFAKEKVLHAGCAAVTGLIVKPFQVETLKDKIATMSNVMETCVPEEVRLPFLEGMKLLEDEKYEEALEVFEKALALDPEFKEAQEAMDAIKLGKL